MQPTHWKTGHRNRSTTSANPLDAAVRRAMRRRSSFGAGAIVTALTAALPIAAAAPFPPVFPLASLFPAGGGDGSRGVVLAGVNSYDRAGYSVRAAGDVNGDGIDDVLIGAQKADPGGRESAGASYVVFGTTQGFSPVFPLGKLFAAHGGDGSHGFVLAGIDAFDLSGISVSGAGDVNGDGIDDLIVGAVSADPSGKGGAGESYVVFGTRQSFPPVFQLAGLFAAHGGDGTRGFVLAGADDDDESGIAVSAAGDVNGDGIDDLLIGADGGAPGGKLHAGESFVVFGGTSAFPPVFQLASLFGAAGGDGSQGFVLTGVNADDASGYSVSAAGDVNGDGYDDIIIGAENDAPYGIRAGAGVVSCISGGYGDCGRSQTDERACRGALR